MGILAMRGKKAHHQAKMKGWCCILYKAYVFQQNDNIKLGKLMKDAPQTHIMYVAAAQDQCGGVTSVYKALPNMFRVMACPQGSGSFVQPFSLVSAE